ncbi:MAG: glycerol-3-phosphate 1-O-acyltransferase PlsY [Gammaproteobacteria bacterium]|nr:glycerol-3-phosphate 1-O-acyltransferase PlsY [Gammaproteobacteria bacterium]MDX5375364.1 glycerol-3-phosphate 1-O-acyltransferase PlsY [Gammaproteobacteria bacterium]
MLENSLLIVAAYLLGSVATAIITCRLMGLPDPRGVGSGNPGATNVLREGGKKAAIITLLGDMLKGLIPVLVGHALGVADWVLAAIGLAAFIGHLYPVYFGFKGGKGVATALGVSLGFHWGLGLAVLGTWLAMAFLTRISSLSALTASLLAPLYAWLITGSTALTVAAALMAALVFWRHRSNIRNLLNGTEGRIGAKK